MAVTLYTEDEVYQATLAYFTALFPGADLTDRGYFGLLARAFAQVVVLAQYGIEQVDNDRVPAYQFDADGNARSRCSSEALDQWAFVFGLPSGVPGIYGRRGATISTGGVGIPSGTAGTVVPAGTLARDSTTLITVKTTASVTLSGTPNTVPVGFISVTTGAQANLPVNSVLTWVSPPAGLGSTVKLTQALIDAQDVESDSDLVARLLRRIQTPPKGGTAGDYRTWGEEATDGNGAPLSIYRAYPYPLRGGLGTVDVVAVLRSTGIGRQPPAAIITALQAYLNQVRPITATVTAYAPSMLAVNALRLRVKATPTTAKNNLYAWDWLDGGVPTTITAHTSTTITVAAVPAGLAAAFAAGGSPRIQVIISTAGASPLPFVSRVVDITGTTITLEDSFVVAPTDAVDYFWAGSAVVLPIATRILAYVDALGPSRRSGYADPNDAWEDSVLMERLADIIMETRDTDGTRMIDSMPGYTVGTATQVAVGAGAFSFSEYRARDAVPNTGPELAYLRQGGIEVLQQ